MKAKKWIWLFFVFIFVCQLCACSSEITKDAVSYNKFSREIVEVDRETDAVTQGWIAASSEKRYIILDIIRGLKEDGTEGIIDYKWYDCDFNTGEKKELKYESLDLKSCLNYLPGGNTIVINSEKRISVYDNEQKLICERNIDDLDFTETDEKRNTVIEKARYVFGDGEHIYIIGVNAQSEGIVYVLDESLNGKLAEMTKSDWDMTFQYGENIVFYDEKNIYSYIPKKNSVKNVASKPSNVIDKNAGIDLYKGTSEYEYLYITRNHVDEKTGEKTDYLMGISNGKHEKIMDFVSMGIQDLIIMEVCGDGAAGYWFVCENASGKKQNIHFVPGDSVNNYSSKSMKTCCKIGMVTHPEDILPEIDKFNLQSDAYYLEIVDYIGMYEDIDVANMHLFMDVLSGDLDAVFLDNQLAAKLLKNDALYDLKDYVNSSSVFKQEDFITHYLDSVTTESGQIYALYPSFDVAGFVYNDYIDFSSLDSYSDLLEKDKRFIVSFDGNDLLHDILKFSGTRYLDEKTGKLRDDSSELLKVMEFLKKQISYGRSYADEYTQLCNGEAKAAYVEIPDPYYYRYIELLMNDNLFVSNVSANQLLISNRKGLMGISVKSEKKEGIMAFWDFLFEPSFYHKEYTSSCFKLPIFKNEYNTWEKRLMATESYVDEYGIEFEIIDATYGFGESGRIIERGSMSREDIKEILLALQEADYIKPMDDDILNLILEETIPYFKGQRTLEETHAIMQSRLDIAVEERK